VVRGSLGNFANVESFQKKVIIGAL